MIKQLNQVKEFHEKFGIHVGKNVGDVDGFTATLRASLIEEEAKSERYPEYKRAVIDTLETFSDNPKRGYLKAHELIVPLRERFVIKRVFTYFALFFKDVVNYNIGHERLFKSYDPLIKKLAATIKNPLPLIVATYEISKKVDDYVNTGLLVDELLIKMVKETTDE